MAKDEGVLSKEEKDTLIANAEQAKRNEAKRVAFAERTAAHMRQVEEARRAAYRQGVR